MACRPGEYSPVREVPLEAALRLEWSNVVHMEDIFHINTAIGADAALMRIHRIYFFFGDIVARSYVCSPVVFTDPELDRVPVVFGFFL